MAKYEPTPTCDGDVPCGSIAVERNRYFTGKYMTARDFADEQAYQLSRHRLHNRLFHGWGIVCGLEVVKHKNPACADRWVIVKPGIAVDCCGRELVIPCDVPVKLPIPWVDRTTARPSAECGQQDAEEKRETPFFLCLCYDEEAVEDVPVLYGERCPHEQREHNRVREKVKIVTRDYKAECWGGRDVDAKTQCRDDCDEAKPTGGSCLVPECLCGECIPIAYITDFRPDAKEDKFCIDLSGRQEIGTAKTAALTHIVEISWTHGGSVTSDSLRVKDDGNENGELWVRFDRPIKQREGDVTGINRHTFVVQYSGLQKDLEFLAACKSGPYLDEKDPCRAVFPIRADDLKSLPGNHLYITLRCDFILDCHDRPVDGNHLGGRRPTGDEIPGGTFESWVFVKYGDGKS